MQDISGKGASRLGVEYVNGLCKYNTDIDDPLYSIA